MRTIAFLLMSISLITACDGKIDITQPAIINLSNLNGVGDTIVFKALVNLEIDDEIIAPDYYKWEIINNNTFIYPDSIYDNSMVWIPQQAGNYIIYLTVGYDNNKSITTLKEIEIMLTPNSIQSKLTGTWKGYYVGQYGFKGDDLSLIIYQNGHFIGNSSNDFVSTMYWGIDIDVQCARIVIERIENSKGYGKVYVPFGSYDNDPDAYCCEFLLQEVEFFSDFDSLTFKVQDFGCNFNNYSIQHYLKKN